MENSKDSHLLMKAGRASRTKHMVTVYQLSTLQWNLNLVLVLSGCSLLTVFAALSSDEQDLNQLRRTLVLQRAPSPLSLSCVMDVFVSSQATCLGVAAARLFSCPQIQSWQVKKTPVRFPDHLLCRNCPPWTEFSLNGTSWCPRGVERTLRSQGAEISV